MIDISRPVSPATAPWPGDEPFTCGWTMRRADGASVNVGWTRASVHVGTHADAPWHFDDRGARAHELPLEAFHGPCRVVRVRNEGEIAADEVGPLASGERLLLKTADAVDPTRFPDAFAWPSLALARALADAACPLVGTDAPSVDAKDSKDLAAHRALARGRVQILENLDLTHVPEGRYTLVALPLKLVDLDGAPVRAALLPR